MKVLLDTNVLGRLATRSDPEQKHAEEAVASLRQNGYQPSIVPQDLFEYWVIATRPKENNGFGMTPAEAAEEISNFKAVFAFCEDSPRIFQEWEKIVSTYGVVGKTAHDARFVAAAIVHGIKHFLTINIQDFRRYREITVLSLTDALQLDGSDGVKQLLSNAPITSPLLLHLRPRIRQRHRAVEHQFPRR